MTDWTMLDKAEKTKQKMAEHKKIVNELKIEGFKQLYPFEENLHYSRKTAPGIYTLLQKKFPEVMVREIIKHMPFEIRAVNLYKETLNNYSHKTDVMVQMFQKIDEENNDEKFVNHRVAFHMISLVFLKAKILLHLYDERAIKYYQVFTNRFVRGDAEQFVEDIYDWTRNPDILPAPEEIVEKYNDPHTDPMLKYAFASLGSDCWVYNVLQPYFLEDTDPIIHQCLAFSTIDEEVLDKLAEDDDWMVRYLVAVNENTASETLVKIFENSCKRLLNGGDDHKHEWEIVRESLAHKNFPSIELEKSFEWLVKTFKNSDMPVQLNEDNSREFYDVLSGIALNPNISFDLSMELVEYSDRSYSLLFNLLANSEISSIVKEIVLGNVEEAFRNSGMLDSEMFE